MVLAERRTNVNEEVDLTEIERQKVEEEIEEEEKERRVCLVTMTVITGQ